jgi:hypothetical protein
VLSCRHEPLQDEYLKVLKHVALLAAHDFDELWRHLEGRALEAEIFGRAAKDESVVDVDDVALAVEQDVAVVAVLDLDEVGDNTIGRAALDELALSRKKLL